MKNNKVRKAVTIISLLTTMTSSSVVLAWTYTKGYPLPAVSGVGSGVLGAATTAADRIRFTCPSTVAGAFSFIIRAKNAVATVPYAYVEGGGAVGYTFYNLEIIGAFPGNFTTDYKGGNTIWSETRPGAYNTFQVTEGITNVNGPNFVLRIAKSTATTAIENYELGVRCLQSDNLTMNINYSAPVTAAPLSATYLQNQ